MTEHKTLLEGNIRPQLIKLAWPLLLGNILQQLYNSVDSLIIRRVLGTGAFAAVGVAGTVMNLFIFISSGFCTGLTILFGRFYGNGDAQAFRRESFVSFTFGSLFILAASGIFLLVLVPALRLIGTPETLLFEAESYLRIIIIGMIATYFYNLFSAVLRAVGETSRALLFLLLAMAENTLLDILLVAFLGLGVEGAALATVLSQLTAAGCCYGYIRRRHKNLLFRKEGCGLHTGLLRQTLYYGFANALQQSSLYIGKILVQGAVNTLGVDGIAAYTVTMRIEGIANSFGESGTQALSVFIAQNCGAGNDRRVQDGLRSGMKLQLCLGCVMAIFLFILAEPGARLFLSAKDTPALSESVRYLR